MMAAVRGWELQMGQTESSDESESEVPLKEEESITIALDDSSWSSFVGWSLWTQTSLNSSRLGAQQGKAHEKLLTIALSLVVSDNDLMKRNSERNSASPKEILSFANLLLVPSNQTLDMAQMTSRKCMSMLISCSTPQRRKLKRFKRSKSRTNGPR